MTDQITESSGNLFAPKTELGKKLAAIRQRALDAGMATKSWEELCEEELESVDFIAENRLTIMRGQAARIKQLEEALKPFAALPSETLYCSDETLVRAQMKAGNIRRAREVLNKGKPE